MNSRVHVLDLAAEKEVQFQIVFPRHADVSKKMIPSLRPLGWHCSVARSAMRSNARLRAARESFALRKSSINLRPLGLLPKALRRFGRSGAESAGLVSALPVTGK
jgi:hypothetical protein